MLVGLGAMPLAGQEEVGTRSLEALLNTTVNIATRMSQREDQAPSIVSVVTRNDIERYGWRDLMDVLRSLPGFEFALDATGLVGLSERGIWAHEGKALVMVDGICVSPLHNGNLNYYGFLPAAMIDRVEVIRGPGSAVYGQFAGVAVINVLTRNPEAADGGRFAINGTSLGAGNNGAGGFLTASDHLGRDAFFSISVGYQSTPFSNRPFVAAFSTGDSFPQDKGNARRENTNITGELQALGTDIKFVRTDFQYSEVDGAGNGPLDPAVPGLAAGVPGSGDRVVEGIKAQHSFTLGRNLVLQASAEEIQNNMGVVYPESAVGDGVFTSGDTRSRFTGDLTLKWSPDPGSNLLLGGGTIQDWERSVTLQNQGGLRDPNQPGQVVPQITLDTHYVYGQFDQGLGPFALTAGGRYESNSIGHAFAPRIGVTYGDGPFNGKLLYGQAFREPSIFQEYSTLYTFVGYVKPELIYSTELELGWHFSPNAVARVNLYRIAVTRCIEGALTSGGQYFISNNGQVHSKGLEARLDTRYEHWGAFGNLSITRPDGEVDPHYLASDGKNFLGVPCVKLNLGAFFVLGPVQIGPSLVYASARQAQTALSANSGDLPGTALPALAQSESLPARVLVNLAVTWNDWSGPGTTARVVVSNLGNADYPLIQPYYGGHPPLPANDRSFTAELGWRF
jgi:outer membrane cobalamin receptor